MKAIAALVIGLCLAIAVFPAVLAGGDNPPVLCGVIGGDMGAILQTIRTLESGGRYDAQAPGSSASGAYQFTDATWADYAGYQRAADAPPDTQDARAIEHVTQILAANNNDVSLVPVIWYIGHVPTAAEWDQVPFASAGNVLTPRQYQTKWMTIYRTIAPTPDASTEVEVEVEVDQSEQTADEPGTVDPTEEADSPSSPFCVGGSVVPLPGGWSLPGPEGLLTVDATRRSHHDYPAWDWGIPEGTPLYAVRGGTITSITNYPRNWFDAGCTTGGNCGRCGIGVTITDDQGTRWTYCHGSHHTITGSGQTVVAGQQILWSGNTGRSTGPHLHLSVTTADGVARCPQLLLESLLTQGVGLDPNTLPSRSCTH